MALIVCAPKASLSLAWEQNRSLFEATAATALCLTRPVVDRVPATCRALYSTFSSSCLALRPASVEEAAAVVSVAAAEAVVAEVVVEAEGAAGAVAGGKASRPPAAAPKCSRPRATTAR